jgi:hypothetical protein
MAAATALLLSVPAGASAAPAPVLEFVAPGHSLPVSFTTESGPVSAEMAGFTSLVHCEESHGEGEITGPRSTVSKYRFTGCVTKGGSNQKCKSENAGEEEIVAGPIEADLVYVDQEKREVAMLLNPAGGTYISFECGSEAAKGVGPFLAPVSPLDQEATTFTATLSQSGSLQTPDEYEGPGGERLKAIPEGERGTHGLVTTGVEMAATVHTSVPVDVEALTSAEVEAKQREEEATRQRQQKQREEEAAATKRHEEEAAATKRHEEEAAAKKHQEEEAAAKTKREEEARKLKSKPLTRGQLLAKALRQCKKEPQRRRARCVARAHERYGPKRKKGKGHPTSHTTGPPTTRPRRLYRRSAHVKPPLDVIHARPRRAHLPLQHVGDRRLREHLARRVRRVREHAL